MITDLVGWLRKIVVRPLTFVYFLQEYRSLRQRGLSEEEAINIVDRQLDRKHGGFRLVLPLLAWELRLKVACTCCRETKE